MKNDAHEQIQRYLNGRADAEESAALQASLKNDADLRALYLDYMNLDVALAGAAAAIQENARRGTTTIPQQPVTYSPRYWHWFAAAAACAALVLFVVLPGQRRVAREHEEISAAISLTKSAVARMSVEPMSPLPAWMSPTASLLNQPRIPQ